MTEDLYTNPPRPDPRCLPFAVIAKPAGGACNLDCRYCFYKDKAGAVASGAPPRMSDRVLETYIRSYVESQPTQETCFNWQGGEPSLLGLVFFRRVIAIQDRVAGSGTKITNTFQTNGMMLDEQWADFFLEHDVLVGLSIDGPPAQHDSYRVDHKGRPTQRRVMDSLRLLLKRGVAVNTLTVVHKGNVRKGREIYRYLRQEGVEFMQFIPLIERVMPDGRLAPPPGHIAVDTAARPAPWSVPPLGFGTFLNAVFDEWHAHDVGRRFVQQFEVHAAQFVGLPASLCVFAEICGRGLAIERNGDVFACDHYVYPEYRLGNLVESPLRELANLERQDRFGRDKRDTLTEQCRACRFLFLCHGGCPKHRTARSKTGEPGHNILCSGYHKFFRHTAERLEAIAATLGG